MAKRLCRARQLVVLIGLLLAGPAIADPTHVVDAAGRNVEITNASRIVSIGGSITEILYALGLEDRVVAVDLTSNFPKRTQSKPSIGYVRSLSPEGVLSLAPTLILAIDGAGPKEAIEVLEKAAVPFVVVPDDHDAAGIGRKIRMIAAAVGAPAEGEALAKAVDEDLGALADLRDKIGSRRKAVFLLGMTAGSPIVAGRETSADAAFALAGVDNAASAMTGFKAASDEMLLASGADAVVIMAERGHDLTAESVFKMPAFATTPAAQERRLIVIGGSYLLGFGPRVAHAARDLAAAIYPDLDLPALPKRPWTDDAEPLHPGED